MKKAKIWLMTMAIPFFIGGGLLAFTTPQMVLADGTDGSSGSCDGNGIFLGFPAWYRGIMDGDSKTGCAVKNGLGLDKIVWTVALNILDIGLLVVGYVSVGYVIYGGFLMMVSRGKPDEIAEGQKTVRNAIIGLVISFGSVAAVNFIVGGIK